MYMPIVSDIMRQQMTGIAQNYVNRFGPENNYVAREATRADLGIIDQNLDDKIGMEP